MDWYSLSKGFEAYLKLEQGTEREYPFGIQTMYQSLGTKQY